MFLDIPSDVRRKLWPHQVNAIAFAIDHLKRSKEACLIRMPTGTGKTGVIASLAVISNPRVTLVLTPWANLRSQMVEALQSKFWKDIGVNCPKPTVLELLPTSAKRALKHQGKATLIATFATLDRLRRDHKSDYDELSKRLSLVIADECHYEPAVEWGKSVKGLGVRTVLLTATPYRNDLKLFQISNSKASTFHFTHNEATPKIIRELTFLDLDCGTDLSKLATAFAKEWGKAKRERRLPSTIPRAIVCCAGATDIETTVRCLRANGVKAIGIHEKFVSSGLNNLYRDVPDLTSETAEVWVHQHKLTEGLDDHRFCCVVLFTKIRNDRKLIQQIGRVLRRNGDDRSAPALMMAPIEYSAREAWNAYRTFETDLRLLDPAHFRDVVRKMLSAQPDVEYFDGKFRRRFDVSVLEKNPQIVVAPSVLVRKIEAGFSFDQYVKDCTDTINTEDAVILGPTLNGPCQRNFDFALWIYASVRNSSSLQSASLYEITLDSHCAVVSAGYLLISDTRGFVPREYLEEATVAVGRERLEKYLDSRFRPTHISIDSSIPYDTVVRGADLRGHNIQRIPPSLTDRIQICRSVRGAAKDKERRYVGMSNGRLRKEESANGRRQYAPQVFAEWARSVARILDSKAVGSEVFRRFMSTCAAPNPAVPKTICIDFLRQDLDIETPDGRECSLKTTSTTIVPSGGVGSTSYECEFDVEAKELPTEKLKLSLKYDAAKHCFWFTKNDGPSIHVGVPGGTDASVKGLAEFLNQNQDIVLIGMDGGEIVYQGRNFYRIDYGYAERSLVGLIERPTNPARIGTEKGTKEQLRVAKDAAAKVFPKGSLFRAIADGQIHFPYQTDVLICADMGTECADFVAASFAANEMALVHAKVGSGSAISASAFHEIASQAMKNLVYLTRNAEVPKGVGSWSPIKKWNGTGVARVLRCPSSLPSGAGLWQKMRTDILGHSSPRLYVTLVTSGCCDVQALRDAVSDATKRTPETAQLLHLLDGLNSYSRQLGIRLNIYDLPFDAVIKRRGAAKKPRRMKKIGRV